MRDSSVLERRLSSEFTSSARAMDEPPIHFPDGVAGSLEDSLLRAKSRISLNWAMHTSIVVGKSVPRPVDCGRKSSQLGRLSDTGLLVATIMPYRTVTSHQCGYPVSTGAIQTLQSASSERLSTCAAVDRTSPQGEGTSVAKNNS